MNMASASKKAASETTQRRARTEESQAAAPAAPAKQSDPQHPADAQPELKPRRKKVEMVSVSVPRLFHLTDDENQRHTYSPGIQDMPLDHAKHWYAEANGVEINE
jgi:hypothetical protein